MANLNYVGSVAERFMKFRSSLATEENISENLFDAVSIYLPKSLASNNLAVGSYDPSAIDADHYGVVIVTVDNYKEVLKDTGSLLSQWLPVFNDGANVAVTLYVVIFDDTGFAVTVGDKAIAWQPLSKAFNELYFISCFKTMFSEHYNGNKVESDPAQATDYDDSNYFDMALCLSNLCENELTLSVFLCEIAVEVPTVAIAGDTVTITDNNVTKIMSVKKEVEVANATTFTGSTLATRAQYFWGFLYLLGMKHTLVLVHNGSFMLPIILGSWFDRPNITGLYIGNKLAKIRLTGNKVKPTGLPSPLNGNVNLNLEKTLSDILDEKLVGYFISIADNSLNNAELISDKTGSGMPVTAYLISKYIDYKTSQDVAKYVSSLDTLTNPVLANQEAYENIQGMLASNLQLFSGLKRLENVVMKFPPFSEAKKGNSFEGIAVWSAVYIDDLESVTVTGSVSF